jgi:hypothetical protein
VSQLQDADQPPELPQETLDAAVGGLTSTDATGRGQQALSEVWAQ